MQDPVDQFLREMRTRSGFYTGNNTSISFSSLRDMFSMLEDEIENMFYNLWDMFHVHLLGTEFPVLRETQQEDLERYGRAYNLIIGSFNRMSQTVSDFDRYLQQEKLPSKIFTLQDRNDETQPLIEAIDKRVRSYLFYAKKEPLPSLDEAISLFYDVIEKYNRYVDIFNQRNAWAHENVPSCFNLKIPKISKLENLKNWNPGQILC